MSYFSDNAHGNERQIRAGTNQDKVIDNTWRGRKTNDSKQLELFAVTVVEYIEAECDVFLELTALL